MAQVFNNQLGPTTVQEAYVVFHVMTTKMYTLHSVERAMW